MMRIRIQIAITLTVILLTPALQAETIKNHPTAELGVLDLRNWDFKQDGPIDLYGQWRFYWKELLSPNNSLLDNAPEPTGFMMIPRYWNDYLVEGKKLKGEGYATFVLKVILPEHSKDLAFRLKDIQTAYRFFVNGKEVAVNGIVGNDHSSSVPSYLPIVADYTNEKTELDIVIHVSNFHHRKGGIWESK